MPFLNADQIKQVEVIAPNLKTRLTGVTSTVIYLVPRQASLISIATTGMTLPDSLPRISLWRLLLLPRNRDRVWHARRNTEMLAGIVLKYVFCRKLVLMFTSASQRHHSNYTRWLISKMARVVATSEKSASFLKCPSQVIMHGIDTDVYSPPADRAGLRKQLGLPDAFLVGCYGRVRPSKGVDIFVSAMIALLPNRPNIVAIVMGLTTGGHQKFLQTIKGQVRDAGLADRILFLPFLPETAISRMADWYRVLDLYIAPQRHEGFGLTPFEAMASAVPVVATRTGAFDRLVVPGETGALADPGDRENLIAATAPLLDDPDGTARMGKAARQRVLDHFDIRGEARTLVDFYRSLLEKHAS